jgi:hypothetical protein
MGCEEVFMTNEQSSESAKPGVSSFDDPAASVAAQLAAIFIMPVPAVASVRHESRILRSNNSHLKPNLVSPIIRLCHLFQPRNRWIDVSPLLDLG